MSSRPSHRETEAELDRESVATTLFSLQSRGKRDRELNFVRGERSRYISKKSLNGFDHAWRDRCSAKIVSC